ncbi:uncharacterized protein N7459_000987 [Penicillium hispanicum]|uniref:uncharacterized protein n=1 Tax=Penicillium hispanicum TaxID=1080232 RepID=UPI002540590B|nr:uncharacterized protein N7459_000987 [Penicillium hispanicum]KAJ5594779.1 hypothetical protein N7459_000987 [Penicillium hispanicum]
MGDLHSRRSPPFPSPTETLSPVAVPQPHHLQPPQSPSSYQTPNDHDHVGLSAESVAGAVDESAKLMAQQPRLSRGDSAEQVVGLTPITEDTRSGSERQDDQGRSSQTLKELRRQMEELLVYQQMQQHQQHLSSLAQTTPGNSNETPRKRRLSTTSAADIPPTIVHPSSSSIGSGGTVKGTDDATSPGHAVGQTPSYPFPRVQSERRPILEQTPRQSQFRLKLPSDKPRSSISDPAEEQNGSQKAPSEQPSFLPKQQPKASSEESEFASPSLYDLTLKLHADPGIDAWWSNLVDILQAHYGAERVSLAVPGDATDLENVPWGQKAIFNRNTAEAPEGTQALSLHDNEPLPETPGQRKSSEETSQKQISGSYPKASVTSSMRPPLSSRHSFAGFGYSKKQLSAAFQDRHQNIPKITPMKSDKKHARIVDQSNLFQTMPSSSGQRNPSLRGEPNDSMQSYAGDVRQGVFPIPRPLEVETDPLIKRTGVVKLFGRTHPIVLTREYSEDSMPATRYPAQSPLDTVQVTPNNEPSPGVESIPRIDPSQQKPALTLGTSQRQFYDEYEQIPQSPWSQSPAPSPAPRTHADQNPFFSNHAVDEGAFEKNPPPHDYSNTHPLEAIGVDHSKTVIHIPLLHGSRFSQSSSSTLRFPVAIVSLLSTIVPYPHNLRQSLAQLMPHLTTSFCLAQQYSQLERQLTSRMEAPQYGNLLGLGGTFSDASSELELVAGLSGHVSYSVGDENSMSARASVASPSDRSSTKFSPAISSLGTPGAGLSNLGFGSASHSPGFVSRSGDGTDSYFNVQYSKAQRENLAQQRPRFSKSRASLVSSTPTSPGKLTGKGPNTEETGLHDPTPVVASPLQEIRPPSVLSPTQQSSRQASTNSFYAQLQRDMPRPFSDTIAQLMLNSIPLHLFLAKPQSGEVIWTNAKFDAYRRSKPQEQKLRDPWQNIHSSERDHVASEWANALRTGSQFTERVRVRRFNDETAYRWFIFRANPLLSSTGEVLYWIGSFLDIHEQHIAELKAIQEREKFATDAKYRAFSNSIPQVVFEATENRGLIFVNEQWNLYTGQKLEQALDLGFAKHVHPDDLEKCGGLSVQTTPSRKNADSSNAHDNEKSQLPAEIHGVSSALDELVRRGVASLQKDENGRIFYSTEIRLRSRGGDFRWHLVRLVLVETSSFGSEEASWYGTCTDINDRKNLERELNKAMSQLNNQMESKTKFFSNMSHEIRTPLNGILGTIPFIMETQLDSDQRQMITTIQNSSTNLRELVDNILDVSRVEAGKMSMLSAWFYPREVIEDVIDTVASRAVEKGLEINYLMDADVPELAIGDKFRIRQVLINLVGNAVKFTAQGEVHISCNMCHDASTQAKGTETYMNFDVVDTGKGFSPQDAERLMQRFSQLGSNGSQQHAGSGLGLFLSKQLVEMHGGKLTPSSMEGQGAKFSFYVKIDAPPPPPPSERPSLLRQASTAARRTAMARPSFNEQNAPLPPRVFDPKLQDSSAVSPGLDSPATQSPEFGHSATSPLPKSLFPHSASSSALPTPDISTAQLPSLDHAIYGVTSHHQPQASAYTSNASVSPPIHLAVTGSKRSVSPDKGAQGPEAVLSHDPYSIVILCPLENSRKSITQHIEHVIPSEIPFKITTLPDIDEWKDTMQPGSNPQTTHLVLNLPATDDLLEVLQQLSEWDVKTAPAVVVMSDHQQKRQVNSRVKELVATGKRISIVLKPVKPSTFSPTFDPESKRELSKDRNQDMAREVNNNFKTVSKMVKEVLGNKGYRILLVEDDETNREVMLKYLNKIKLMSETASNGQECIDKVFSKEPGYFSLIICDIQMPMKNGYDTCREIRTWEQKNHYPQIPIMALSANAMTDQIEDAARAGFNDYVTKPIKHNELGKMMMGLLDPSRPLLLLRDRLHPSVDPTPSARR